MISVLQEGFDYLKSRSVPEAEASSEFLLSHVVKVGRAQIQGGLIAPISPAEKKKFLALIRRRAHRQPLAYVTGSQPFLDLKLLCGPGVLIPRPETEELVFKVFKSFEGRERENLLFLAVGAGTGAISISLAHYFKKARVFAMEKSVRAKNWMRKNLSLYPEEARRISLIHKNMLQSWGLGRLRLRKEINDPFGGASLRQMQGATTPACLKARLGGATQQMPKIAPPRRGWPLLGCDFVTHRLHTAEGMLALRSSSRSKIGQPNRSLISLRSLKFDMIVSNPPYIPSSEIKRLELEVLREPRMALDGGPDGLRYLRRIFSQAMEYLKPKGIAIAEIGFGQGAEMRKIMKKAGFERAEVQCDSAGIPRFAIAQKDTGI